MNGFYIRYSCSKDIEEVSRLLLSCFGEMVIKEKAFDGIPYGKYLLMFNKENNELVAMSGLCHSNEFPGPQMTWSCTKPEYRHKGLMKELFKRVLITTDQDIYCNCWRIGKNDFVNLHAVMDLFGFVKIDSDVISRESRTCNVKSQCPYYNSSCCCHNDTYMRKGSCNIQ